MCAANCLSRLAPAQVWPGRGSTGSFLPGQIPLGRIPLEHVLQGHGRRHTCAAFLAHDALAPTPLQDFGRRAGGATPRHTAEMRPGAPGAHTPPSVTPPPHVCAPAVRAGRDGVIDGGSRPSYSAGAATCAAAPICPGASAPFVACANPWHRLHSVTRFSARLDPPRLRGTT